MLKMLKLTVLSSLMVLSLLSCTKQEELTADDFIQKLIADVEIDLSK
jgi:hypothetical protein